MSVEQTDVNKQETATESSTVETEAQTDSSTSADATADVQTSDGVEKVQSGGEARIPKERLDEVIAQREKERQEKEELRRRLDEIEKQRQPIPTVDPEKQLDDMAEQLSLSKGVDEFGDRVLPKATARAIIESQRAISQFDGIEIKVKYKVDEFCKKNNVPENLRVGMEEWLNRLPPQSRLHDMALKDALAISKGNYADKLEKEAEERGFKRAMENKKIVSRAQGETATSSATSDTKDFKKLLSERERAEAKKAGLTEEQYYNSKMSNPRLRH